MTILISDKPEMNVVNVGDELTQNMIDALNGASGPSSANVYVTKSAGDSAYIEKDGGGTVVGTVVVDTDGTAGGNVTTITGTSVEVNNYGVGTIKMDPVLGITFPDSTSQATAAVTLNLATTAEAIAGTNATKAVTPQGVAVEVARRMARRYYQTNLFNLSVQSTGTGAGYTQVVQYTNIVPANAGIAGFTRGYCIATHPEASVTVDWNKKNGFGCFTRFNNNTAIYNGISIVCGLGYTSSPTAGVALGDLTAKGIGFSWTCGGNVFFQVHDGTTLRKIDTGYTPATGGQLANAYLEAFSDGAGNATALVRVTAGVTGAIPVDYVVTSANAPTGSYATNPFWGYLFQVASSTTHTTVYNVGGLHPTFFYD